jgi:hypothetical protein
VSLSFQEVDAGSDGTKSTFASTVDVKVAP